MNPSRSIPADDRREQNRRSGTERRAAERRFVVDRRLSPAGSRAAVTWLAAEPPAEHVRNAMQLLVGALESDAALTPAEFVRLAENALVRLSLALDALEKSR